MPLGITVIRHKEVEQLYWAASPPPFQGSPEEWTRTLLLPCDWKVVGVSMIPYTDLVAFVIESDLIQCAESGLTYLTLQYMQPSVGPLVLVQITQQYQGKEQNTMPDTPSRNVSSDDAALFSANTPDNSSDMDEDPLGKSGNGASRAGQVDMFRGYPTRPPKATTRGGNREPEAGGFSLTPGAKTCPEIGPGSRKSGRKLA